MPFASNPCLKGVRRARRSGKRGMAVAGGQHDQVARRKLDRVAAFDLEEATSFDDDVERRGFDSTLVEAPRCAKLAHAEHGALEPPVAQDITEKIHGWDDQLRNASRKPSMSVAMHPGWLRQG